jgi:peptide alpha-N-acetyltransferase
MVEAMAESRTDPGGQGGAGAEKAEPGLDNSGSDSALESLAAGLGAVTLAAARPPVTYRSYTDETQMPLIMRLIQKDLSEPYSIYTYRYFIHNWPNLCFLAMAGEECVGAIVCKLDLHKKVSRRGYIAMLAVDEGFRKMKIGSTLVKKAIEAMIADDADEVVLETEITNKPALKLYEALGFVRDKRLFRYYLNGVDASRLKLWLR